MKYQSIKEKAAEVRKQLKEIGITSKQVSVKSGYCGYSDKLNITIKDLSVKEQTVKEIAKQYEEYERDERSGEILEGGNTYVFIEFDYDTKRKAMEEMLPKAIEIQEAGKELRQYECNTVVKADNLEVTYIPGDHSIRLIQHGEVTDSEGTYRSSKTLSNHTAWNEYDIASALGFWKYQYNLAI